HVIDLSKESLKEGVMRITEGKGVDIVVDGVRQTEAPGRLIEGGLLTEATVAHVLVSKYADRLPLCRQSLALHTDCSVCRAMLVGGRKSRLDQRPGCRQACEVPSFGKPCLA